MSVSTPFWFHYSKDESRVLFSVVRPRVFSDIESYRLAARIVERSNIALREGTYSKRSVNVKSSLNDHTVTSSYTMGFGESREYCSLIESHYAHHTADFRETNNVYHCTFLVNGSELKLDSNDDCFNIIVAILLSLSGA